MHVIQRNSKIRNVRPLGFTPKHYEKCLQSLKLSHSNASSFCCLILLHLIRLDINLIFLSYFSILTPIFQKKQNAEALCFQRLQRFIHGCGGRTRTYDLRVSKGIFRPTDPFRNRMPCPEHLHGLQLRQGH